MDIDEKWHDFEKSGSIADYLNYRGVTLENVTETAKPDNCQWNCSS